jgi:hypothetical protein
VDKSALLKLYQKNYGEVLFSTHLRTLFIYRFPLISIKPGFCHFFPSSFLIYPLIEQIGRVIKTFKNLKSHLIHSVISLSMKAVSLSTKEALV